MTNMRFCKICGDKEEDHHEPDWLEIPKGCVCNWREWDYYKMISVPSVCGKYVGDGNTNCETCEHDLECHAA